MAGIVGELGIALHDLAEDQAAWSQATFGNDAERGPIGALKHLGIEAAEAERAYRDYHLHASMEDTAAAHSAEMNVRDELADCFLLVLDASRRAGLSPQQLIRAAQAKMLVNKAREWPKTVGDVPTEHKRPD